MRNACPHNNPVNAERVFCADCGKVVNRARLESVRLMGAIGPYHTSNENVQRFFATGDPTGA